MDILSLFTREEAIAGLDVSDQSLRLTLLSFNKKKFSQEVKALVEEILPPGVMMHGLIADEVKFVAALNNLLKKSPLKIRYLVLSLAIDSIYARIFSFPRNIGREKLGDSINLATNYQLPFKREDAYVDWEELASKDKNEVFLSAIPKTVVNQYVSTLLKAGLKTVAVEFHPFSLLRVIDLPLDQSVLITEKDTNATYLYIVKNNLIKYVRVLPIEYVPDQGVAEEISRITAFYETDNGPISQTLNLDDAKVVEKYSDKNLGQPGKWLVSLGAAARGIIPRSEDKLISLMPIGTEKAYEYQRATAFSKFLTTMTIVLAIFFSTAYLIVWLLLISIQQRASSQVDSLATVQAPAEGSALEERARKLNSLTQTTSQIITTVPSWSIFLNELKSRVVDGVAVNTANLTSVEGEMLLVGIANSRAQLNALKKSLEESPYLQNVVLPLTNLEQKENIPFTISFRLKDPQLLYASSLTTETEE
jgi:Tfp pilus assembly PilM family ATPase/Tfp pilus assembly protein PilN